MSAPSQPRHVTCPRCNGHRYGMRVACELCRGLGRVNGPLPHVQAALSYRVVPLLISGELRGWCCDSGRLLPAPSRELTDDPAGRAWLAAVTAELRDQVAGRLGA